MPTIEQLWNELRLAGGGQRRVDASHPLDVYVDFELPDRPGLVAVCASCPGYSRSLRALQVEERLRADGRWTLRIILREPTLLPVFAALCRDIIAFSRTGIDQAALPQAVIGRIERWRSLLEGDATGLPESVLRGLIGELLTLEAIGLSTLSPKQAVAAWTGPRGTAQDFVLPSGTRLEVKTISREGRAVRINGLQQLDAGSDALVLIVVRIEATGSQAAGAITAPLLVARIRHKLRDDADALTAFDAALACVGWHDHPSHDSYAVRVLSAEARDVDAMFPRLTGASVPEGVTEVNYAVVLPGAFRPAW